MPFIFKTKETEQYRLFGFFRKKSKKRNTSTYIKLKTMKKLIERLYDKISNFLFGGERMCIR